MEFPTTIEQIDTEICQIEAQLADLRRQREKFFKLPSCFNLSSTQYVLSCAVSGEEIPHEAFDTMFEWEDTPQGFEFWDSFTSWHGVDRCKVSELSDEAIQYLKLVIDLYYSVQ